MLSYLFPRVVLLLTLGATMALLSGSFQQFLGFVEHALENVIFDSLSLVEIHVSSLTRCLLSCSQDARCVSVFYQESRGQCRLQGGSFYLTQGGREEQGWRYYLMEMDPCCPVKSGYIHRRDLSLCYRLGFQVGATHSEAVSNCTQEGGHLLRIDSQEKQDLVEQQLNSSNDTAVNYYQESGGKVGYYIDGKNISGSWVWPSTGQQVTFSNWLDGEDSPKFANQKFIILGGNKNWTWLFAEENRKRSYICELDV